jgi:Na+/proline symporter
MAKGQLDLLSFGVLIVILAILLIAFGPTQEWDKILSLTITLYGLWVVALAGIRVKSPDKYERGAFSTFVMGILLVAVGGAWFLNIETGYLLYSIVLLMVVVGVLAIASALPSLRKKQ